MNKTYIFSAVSFVIGVAVGGVSGVLIAKKKYEERLRTEVESVRDNYDRTYPLKTRDVVIEEEIPETTDATSDTDIFENKNYEAEIAKASYSQRTDYTSFYDSEKSVESPGIPDPVDTVPVSSPERPYVIPDDVYYDDEDTTKIELFLFDNGLITDDAWDPVEEPEKIIPPEALRAFMLNEDQDEIFTKSDARDCMYAIEKQGETWEEFLKNHPIIKETNY